MPLCKNTSKMVMALWKDGVSSHIVGIVWDNLFRANNITILF